MSSDLVTMSTLPMETQQSSFPGVFDQVQDFAMWEPAGQDPSHTFAFESLNDHFDMEFLPSNAAFPDWTTQAVSTSDSSRTSERLIALYYSHFHQAHPFLLPYSIYSQHQGLYPTSLQHAMQIVGGQFIVEPDQHRLENSPEVLLSSITSTSAFDIQTLLLLSLVFYGRNQKQESITALAKAITIGNDLQLYKTNTISTISNGNHVLEESLIRTWWEVINMASLLSTFATSANLPTIVFPRSELPMPCENLYYDFEHLPTSRRTHEEFADRTLFDDPYEYSSYCYKVEASRLLRALQEVGTCQKAADKQRVLVNSLANYQLSMPVQKRDFVHANGHVDETLLQAKTLTSTATILVTRSTSERSTSSTAQSQASPSCELYEDHCLCSALETGERPSAFAIQAADTIADAAGTRSLTCTVVCHSPFFICAIALACSIHIAAFLHTGEGVARDLIKERIKLGLNALTRIGENWPLAKDVAARVSRDVKSVMSARPMNSGGYVPP
jgi:hypothetical protein